MNLAIVILRSIIKNKRYAIPSMIGMSLSISALLLIFQFVSFEFSYDQFYHNRLARVISTQVQEGDEIQRSTVTYSAVGPALVNDYPEIVDHTRLFPFGNSVVHHAASSINITRCVAVEPSFFSMFEQKLLAGRIDELFDSPGQIVLTRTTANRIFGPTVLQDIVNQTVKLDNDEDLYTVVGIVDDMPVNSHLNYNLFISYETIISTWGITQARHDWKMLDFRHYVQIAEETDIEKLNADVLSFGQNHLGKNSNDPDQFELEEIGDIYLSKNKLAYDIAKQGDRQTMYFLISLGLILFIVSWINYLNLNSSLALEKRRTIGIQLALGIESNRLRQSLMWEVAFIYLTAFLVGLGLSFLITNAFRQLDFEIMHLHQLVYGGYVHLPSLLIFVGLLLMAGTISSMFYYRVAIKIDPLSALRVSSGVKVRGAGMINKLLLGLQFTLSMIAFIAGLVVFDQQAHIQAIPVGFSMDNLWVLQQPKLTRSDSTFKSEINTFKSRLLSNPLITRVATNQRTPGQQLQVEYEARVGNRITPFSYLFADQDYLELYKIELISGRGFRPSEVKSQLGNVSHIVVNEAALKTLEVQANEAVGQQIELFGKHRTIIGVIRNYRQESLLHDFKPTVILPLIHSNHQIMISTAGTPDRWVPEVRDIYAQSFPGNSFEYRNLKDDYENQYASVYSASRSIGFFTIFIVLTSMIGMVAMSMLNLLSGIKEIGIRKILGASESRLHANIIRTNLLQFLIACALAIPAAFTIAKHWLQQFTSSIEPSLYHALAPIGIMFLIIAAILFVINRKVISTNPVDILRVE